jgi:NADH:ubiquinone oxidoreductase subunit 5 (subunit L)/multisubunit Na+/H+ antiporter MnhA subunit
MLDRLIVLIPLLPMLAALLLGLGIVSGRIAGEASERFTARLVVSITALSFLLSALATGLRAAGLMSEHVVLGTWLASGDYRIEVSFGTDRLSLGLSLLFALFAWLVARFSVNYMHREAGFHRFFLVLALFAGAMQLLVLAGNAPFTFAGWELAGVCSYLLIAYAYDRPVAAGNATRAFVTNRIGDAGFALGIYLAFAWTGGVEWPRIIEQGARLDGLQAGTLATCFLLAAAAKSAQVPLAPWLARAMEGPTPSSAIFYGAVMIHAGVYLVLRLAPVFEQAPPAMALMAAMGLVTALYGFACGLVQTDVKSALIFSTTGQVGLMFLECGLGLWTLAAWHLAAHAIVRGYQFLTAPSLMHRLHGEPARPPLPALAGRRRLYLAALQRFWLEDLGDFVAVKPIRRFAGDLDAFDSRVVEPVVGLPAPAVQGLSSLAEWEEHKLGAGYEPGGGRGRVSGLPGILVHGTAAALHWFEERLVLAGLGQNLIGYGRRLGTRLNRVEAGLRQPRHLVLLVLMTLLATL